MVSKKDFVIYRRNVKVYVILLTLEPSFEDETFVRGVEL